MAYDADRRAILGRGLKAARQNSELSARAAVVKLAEGGLHCTRGTLLAWERGRGPTSREPFASDLCLIAAIYGCRIEELFLPGENGHQSSSNGPSTGHDDRASASLRPDADIGD